MKTLANELEQILPKALEEIIGANRDKAKIYFSTDNELESLRSPMVFGTFKAPISHWSFITLQIVDSQASFVYLVGFNPDENSSWMTSFVTGINNRLVNTQSGSLYELVGDRTSDPDLEYICATLNLWGLGAQLGVPPIFF